MDMNIKERLEDFEKRLAALERGQGSREPPVIEMDLTLPEVEIDGLYFNEQKVHAVFEKQDDDWYYFRDILFPSARNVEDNNSHDTLAKYLNSYAFKNSIRRQLPEEIFGEVMTPDNIEVSLPKENRGIKKYHGVDYWYWLASPHLDTRGFVAVNSDGSLTRSDASGVGGCAPAFRIGKE